MGAAPPRRASFNPAALSGREGGEGGKGTGPSLDRRASFARKASFALEMPAITEHASESRRESTATAGGASMALGASTTLGVVDGRGPLVDGSSAARETNNGPATTGPAPGSRDWPPGPAGPPANGGRPGRRASIQQMVEEYKTVTKKTLRSGSIMDLGERDPLLALTAGGGSGGGGSGAVGGVSVAATPPVLEQS